MQIIKGLLVIALTFSTIAQATEWRVLDPNKTVLLTLPQGKVVIELAPQFAPNHVTQFIQLARKNHYQDAKFYRVIDGFVAQGGPADDKDSKQLISPLRLEGEFDFEKTLSFTLVQTNDLFAEQTGFQDGFALGYEAKAHKAWMLHCPGVIAMARETGADTATSHFYITIGQAPRYLDRLMTIFGRVVYGMNHVQAITRTENIEGESPVDPADYTSMVSMQLMSDVPKSERINIEVEMTNTKDFQQKLAKRRVRENAFFFKKPPQVLDICQTEVKSRRVN
ncbi:peptidylprolyl isomerase [Thalassotalea piscium]